MLEEYRRRNNLTQTELAKKLGISKSFLCELEHKQSKPSTNMLIHISNILKICPIKLLKFFYNNTLQFNCCKYGCYLEYEIGNH
ncbi:TPA: helix-turn-helix transcriptional regulator [Clostridium perfringens]|nr:helix-turn-helix transcriptional regulator [Clostridium perfringens]